MFKSIFQQRTLTILLQAAMVGGALTMAAQPASAQMQAARGSSLSPGAQQMLSAILRGLPPNAQPLVIHALRTIGPQRAEDQLAQARAMGPETLREVGNMVVMALQGLPVQYHQAFINGLFQVSPAEEQFTSQVLNQIAQAKIGINTMNADTFNAGQAAKRRTDEGAMYSLGPNPYPWYSWPHY
jgi:hypothetical protein